MNAIYPLAELAEVPGPKLEHKPHQAVVVGDILLLYRYENDAEAAASEIFNIVKSPNPTSPAVVAHPTSTSALVCFRP